jgi:hypothetical protein
MLLVAAAAASAGCAATYYRALETVGIEKREILVDRVENARDSQAEAKEQFATALDQYRALVAFDGGDLEDIYDRMNAEYEDSVDSADGVRERIDSVESVAEDLFAEWEDEIEEYSDDDLRRQSQRLLRETRNEYGDVVTAMHRAEAAMAPVLTLFNDQVLFLRHNLNARAIGALETELGTIERATAELITEMERAIDEASRFVEAMAA